MKWPGHSARLIRGESYNNSASLLCHVTGMSEIFIVTCSNRSVHHVKDWVFLIFSEVILLFHLPSIFLINVTQIRLVLRTDQTEFHNQDFCVEQTPLHSIYPPIYIQYIKGKGVCMYVCAGVCLSVGGLALSPLDRSSSNFAGKKRERAALPDLKVEICHAHTFTTKRAKWDIFCPSNVFGFVFCNAKLDHPSLLTYL